MYLSFDYEYYDIFLSYSIVVYELLFNSDFPWMVDDSLMNDGVSLDEVLLMRTLKALMLIFDPWWMITLPNLSLINSIASMSLMSVIINSIYY